MSVRRSIEDAKARLAELERALASEETGADLRSCKRLLNKHQVTTATLYRVLQNGNSKLTIKSCENCHPFGLLYHFCNTLFVVNQLRARDRLAV